MEPTSEETTTNQPFVQPERRPGQVTPGAHAPTASPAGLLRRQQSTAAPPSGGRQILRLKIHSRHLLLGRRRRRGRRNRRRGVELR